VNGRTVVGGYYVKGRRRQFAAPRAGFWQPFVEGDGKLQHRGQRRGEIFDVWINKRILGRRTKIICLLGVIGPRKRKKKAQGGGKKNLGRSRKKKMANNKRR